MKAATYKIALVQGWAEFQSTPPVKAATIVLDAARKNVAISIHAAREGGDHTDGPCALYLCISIHAAREGGDADP